MNAAHAAGRRWTLADLIDFETVLTGVDEATLEHDRLIFNRDIRPALPAGDERGRRRAGLRAWLAYRREADTLETGRLWRHGLGLIRLTLLIGMGIAGFALMIGLCASANPGVHVILFLGVTLGLPWLMFMLVLIAGLLGGRSSALLAGWAGRVLAIATRSHSADQRQRFRALRERLTDTAAPRRALRAALARTLQIGAVGFNTGLVLAFAGSLLVFDVRFYWEATPQTSGLVASATQIVAAPWRGVWPAAVPSTTQIENSRARFVDGRRRVPDVPASTAAWWRFLLMALLVWGLLPRLLLVLAYAAIERRALSRVDFQSPRHRSLWRALTRIERGAVAAPAADSALVLDVGGSGLSVASIRGFLLRALRVNPHAHARIGVLDEADEAAADEALAVGPDHVVLVAEDWGLSPRQAAALHARVRRGVGAQTPVTWLIFARDARGPGAPDAAHLQRWTRFIDGLRDPATEIVAYDPGL
ncbi:hypothetical protein S4A8_17686 [Salinisphaera sp. S4-8]|uniref:DUF2868 domain-containing protein n=1 Tax=Salinisphaera sp. S4-8 TaxID=633357 RepID=UPI00334035E9